MQAAAEERWGSSDLARRTVAIQGCGHVGAPLARELAAAGAHLILSDVNDERAASLARELGARTIAAGEVLAAECDILAPCALGAVLDDDTIPALRAAIVCGAANNQLAQDRHGDALAARGVLYAPDYVANAGGIINGTRALLGWPAERAARAVDAIADTMALVFALARGEGVATHTAADRLAERRMAEGIPTLH
jgi:leucine dehydrogenase